MAKMIEKQKASLRAWVFPCALVIGACIRASFSFELDPDLLKALDVPNSIPVSYHQIKSELDGFKELPAATGRFSLSSFSPFCTKFIVPEVAADVVPECVPWEVGFTFLCLPVHFPTSQQFVMFVSADSDDAFYYRCNLYVPGTRTRYAFHVPRLDCSRDGPRVSHAILPRDTVPQQGKRVSGTRAESLGSVLLLRLF